MQRGHHHVGRLIVSTTRQSAGAPLVDSGTVIDECWTQGSPAMVIRPPFTRGRPVRALVIGWHGWPWRPSRWRRRARSWLRYGNPWATRRYWRRVERGEIIPGTAITTIAGEPFQASRQRAATPPTWGGE